MTLSPKQKQALLLLKKNELKRINIFEGAVRSGKTHVSMIMWGLWTASSPKDSAYLMAGKTITTLKRNVLEPMRALFGECFTYSTAKKEASLFGRKIYLEGCANAESESKIRGITLMGAYCDELSLFSEDFFKMLLSRLSEKGAKLFATTNPEAPYHWLKRDYIDNKNADLLSIKFALTDNIFLPEKYITSLKTEFSGAFYNRYILGEWAPAEGRVYENFGQNCVLSNEELKKRLSERPLSFSTIGVDYGGNGSASAFAHVGFDAGCKNVYLLSEYYDKKNRSAESLIFAFIDFVNEEKEKYPKLSCVFCDSAEQLLIKSFRAAVKTEVKNAQKKPVNQRINMLNRLISSGRFFVQNSCPHTIEALQTALWDERETRRDVRLDNGTTNIDSLDALEYAFEKFERFLFKA